jgi:predicted GNAT superfamily acetyltransferase
MTSPSSSPTSTIVIRDIDTLAEMKEIEQLQREIWGVEDLDVYPALGFKPQKEVGAVLMGAFAEGRMVGFVFGFPGILDGETIIHSDMLGILPDYRSQNLGFLLKLAQRDAAIALGVKRITWTFDPLQSRNAHFNFSKLGVIADRYYPDYYGVTSSFLHRHGTDRLWVTWLVESERVKSRLDAASAIDSGDISQLHHLVRVGDDLEPIVTEEPISEASVVIEIPRDLTANHEQWRMATRDAFTRALDAGYVVEEFISGKYLLKKN